MHKTLAVTINIVSIVGSEKRIRETWIESLDFFLEKIESLDGIRRK